MADEFKPIETQEAFDTAVQSRIDAAVQQYQNWISPEKAAEQATVFQNQIDSLKTENLRLKIAQETGLPSELAARLQGSTEDEIRTDAETLAKFSVQQKTPSFTAETPSKDDSRKAAFMEMLADLRK